MVPRIFNHLIVNKQHDWTFLASSVRSGEALGESDCASIMNLHVSEGAGSMFPKIIIPARMVGYSNAEICRL